MAKGDLPGHLIYVTGTMIILFFKKKKLLKYLKEIHSSQLTVEKANKSDHLVNYLAFDFHTVSFPFFSINVPSCPSYSALYISQLIRYARCCSHYDDLDIANSVWLIDVCHMAIYPCGLRSLLRNLKEDITISLRNT